MPPAPTKRWIEAYTERKRLEHRDRAVKWVLRTFTFALTGSFVILVLQGFKLWGFCLPEPFLHWLGAATVGEVVGLVGVVFKFLFR